MQKISEWIVRYEQWYRSQPWVAVALGLLALVVGLGMLQFNKIFAPHFKLITWLNLLAVTVGAFGTTMILHVAIWRLLRRWVD